jgi:hypothetical protein
VQDVDFEEVKWFFLACYATKNHCS